MELLGTREKGGRDVGGGGGVLCTEKENISKK